MSIPRLAHLLLLSFVVLPSVAWSVTLGEARVNSFLNQPLDVEIDLVGLQAGQHQDVRLRLANQRHFDRLGITFHPALQLLRFDVVQSNNRWTVRARTDHPITEPYLDFPLQMSWPGGQMIKQVTLLLDPPRWVKPPAINATRPGVSTGGAALPPRVAGDRYGPVRRGETLWPIARRLKPSGVTTRQMAMALLRANPQAFIDGNINKLRAGATLRIPARDFIEQRDAATARAEFAAQTQDWKSAAATADREPPSPPSSETPPPSEQRPDSAPLAADDAPAQDATPTDDADAQLRIVTDQSPAKDPEDERAIQDQLLVTMEEIESNRITTGTIESRLSRLEDELARMQQLVDLKDAQIAALRAEISAREAIEQATAQTAPATTAATAAAPPAAAVTIETSPIVVADDHGEPWYAAYLWLVWSILALLGLIAIYLIVRRPAQTDQDIVLADMPLDDQKSSTLYQTSQRHTEVETAAPADEVDQPPVAPTPAPEPAAHIAEASLPDVDSEQITRADEKAREGLSNSLLDDVIELDEQPAPEPTADPDISDDDIASWVDELNIEVQQAEPPSANDSTLSLELDEDIPSILTELNDQLESTTVEPAVTPAEIDVDPVDEVSEDETFSMSLDLARAYLEIGDSEGARDMLEEALNSARDPNHRTQIRELLSQID